VRPGSRLFTVAGVLAALMVQPALAQVTLMPDGPGTYAGGVDALDVRLDVSTDGDGATAARLTVSMDGTAVFEKRYDDLFAMFEVPVVQIAQIDPANGSREVFLSSYTGGAHCCNLVSAVTATASGDWTEVEIGQFDGGPVPENLTDRNGDGAAEFMTHDGRFLYQFASYAGSYAPPLILGVRGGERVDLTAEPDFEWHVRARLDRMGEIPAAGESRNSWLATHAATQLLLGEPDPLARADAEYDPDVNWGLEYCRDADVAIYDCPEAETAARPFPEALRLFLTETGYME